MVVLLSLGCATKQETVVVIIVDQLHLDLIDFCLKKPAVVTVMQLRQYSSYCCIGRLINHRVVTYTTKRFFPVGSDSVTLHYYFLTGEKQLQFSLDSINQKLIDASEESIELLQDHELVGNTNYNEVLSFHLQLNENISLQGCLSLARPFVIALDFCICQEGHHKDPKQGDAAKLPACIVS